MSNCIYHDNNPVNVGCCLLIPVFILCMEICSAYQILYSCHCWQRAQIRSFCWSLFSRIMTEYGNLSFVNFRIPSECGKIRTRKNYEFKHLLRAVCVFYSGKLATKPQNAYTVNIFFLITYYQNNSCDVKLS